MSDRARVHSQSTPHTYSLVAAAEVVTGRGIKRRIKGQGLLDWQEEAWRYYDTVGEFRFGVNWQANALSRVNLVAAAPPEHVGDEPTGIDPNGEDVSPAQKRASELVAEIAGGAGGQGQLLHGFGQHLSVAGFAWLVIEPDASGDVFETWEVYSQDAVRIESQGGEQSISVRITSSSSGGGGRDDWRQLSPEAIVAKVWRKHPRKPWEPDAPVRSVLGVLQQLDLLSAHITASGRSRLAGAGILALPSEIEFPPPPPTDTDDGLPDGQTEQDGFDYFVQNLTDMMTTPIADRDNAAAIVPFTIAVPGEYLDKIKHLTFSTPFDDKVIELQGEAIKRLALGLDMPPEVLTGMAGVNHWTAWQVEETAITLHIEPNAEVVCQALTEAWLAPALEAEGLDPSTAIVWYDTSDLTTPPDKSGNATLAYDRLKLSAVAYRRELGFGEDDAPDPDEFRERVLLDAAKGAPTLAPSMLAAAGILDPQVADAAVEATPEAPEDAPNGDLPGEPPESGDDGPPDADGRPGGDRSAASAVVMACDGIVYRAMERAGLRLKNKIGRTSTNGPQVVEGPLAQLHVRYDPTIYSDLDHLLDGAFDRVPDVAEMLGMDADPLEATLRAYCRSLLASQQAHELIRLYSALGMDAQV